MSSTPEGYRHHALLYDSADDLLQKAVPFLQEGLNSGEAAVLACGPDMQAMLVDGLDDRRVVRLETADNGRPNSGLAVYRHLVSDLVRAGAPRVRVVADMDEGRRPDQWAERARYEAGVNLALADLPVSGVCAYHDATLTQPLRDLIHRTHRYDLGRRGSNLSRTYADPRLVVRDIPAPPADPAEVGEPVLDLVERQGTADLALRRRQVQGALLDAGVATGLMTDFSKAVHEVLVNALLHGGEPMRLRLWIARDRLICTVMDGGAGFDSSLAGYAIGPARGRRSGTGLWLARQLCDQLSAQMAPEGFTVRLIASRTSAPLATNGARARASVATMRAGQARERAVQACRVLKWQEQQSPGKRRS